MGDFVSLPPQAVKSILVWKAKMVRAKVTAAVMPTLVWPVLGAHKLAQKLGLNYRDDDGVHIVECRHGAKHHSLAHWGEFSLFSSLISLLFYFHLSFFLSLLVSFVLTYFFYFLLFLLTCENSEEYEISRSLSSDTLAARLQNKRNKSQILCHFIARLR